MTKFAAEVDWNDPDAGKEKRSDFMKLSEGENVIRVMSNPIKGYVHWIKTRDGKDRKIISPAGSPELVRKLEEAGYKVQPSYMIKVLDRSDKKFKLLEVGPQIFKGIQMLNSNQKWGKVTAYDISINKGPKGTQPLYNVTPNPKEPLESSFQKKYSEFNDSVNLDKLTSPLPDAEIVKLLGWDDVPGKKQDTFQKSSSQDKKAASVSDKSSNENSAFEFDFDNE
jgi:hypothetical protein